MNLRDSWFEVSDWFHRIISHSFWGWLLVIATIGLAVLTYNLVQSSLSSTKSAEEAVKIAQDALRFQQESDSLNRIAHLEEFKIETRAYITVKLDTVIIFANFDSIFVRWRELNVGKTPAKKVRIAKVWSLEEIPLDTLKNRRVSTIFTSLGSGDHDIEMTGVTIERSVATKFMRGERAIYVGIKIEYEDIFRITHHTYGHYELTWTWNHGKPIPDDD